jgi:coenzyme F420-reducing hydrogenase delta subunit/Pyruvate/2-oxoacid:ferredoxin oxidoreductase delta subunit
MTKTKVTIWHEMPDLLKKYLKDDELSLSFKKIPDSQVSQRTCTTFVIPDFCSDCIFCEGSCPNLKFDKPNKIMRVNPIACKGCGVCLPACPTGALQQRNSHLGQMETDLFRTLNMEEKTVPMSCNQCPVTIGEVKHPGNGHAHIRLTCSGRYEPGPALEALANGYKGVLVVGCLYKDFPFKRNKIAMEDRMAFSEKMMKLLGLDPGLILSVPQYLDEGGVKECLEKLIKV